jgi:choline-sulfatase
MAGRTILIALLLMPGTSCAWESVNRGHGRAALGGILVITLDTTRADRLTPYGYMSASMPHLERLAREGVVFEQAVSVAPLTLPAHSSLFTGHYPARHGVRHNASPPLADTATTLAELLGQEGFRTAGFVGSLVLDRERGLAQGFHTYAGVRDGSPRSSAGQRRADDVVDDAIRWLEAGDGRFFLWTHFYDPHRPYDPPAAVQSVSDPYVGEIVFVDSQIGRLMDALERRGALRDTLIVLVGDHGESLGEHGERDHGVLLYESVLHVPLIIRAPAFRPARTPAVVRLVDVMPTILDLAGVPAPSLDGISLTGLMADTRVDPDLEALAESFDLSQAGYPQRRTMRNGRYKVIDGPRQELYDLARDPFELQNLYDERQSLAGAMIRRLRAVSGEAVRTPTSDVPPDLRARLAALGYLSPRQP